MGFGYNVQVCQCRPDSAGIAGAQQQHIQPLYLRMHRSSWLHYYGNERGAHVRAQQPLPIVRTGGGHVHSDCTDEHEPTAEHLLMRRVITHNNQRMNTTRTPGHYHNADYNTASCRSIGNDL